MKHAIYGGSTAKRWMNCHLYATLVLKVPRRPAGPAAWKGTAQHDIMEQLLKDPDKVPESYLGATVRVEDRHDIEITADMVDAMRIALDAWESLLAEMPEDAAIFAEKTVSFKREADGSEGEVFGTLDGGIVAKTKAIIVDFKFGREEVTADTSQSQFYMVCARKDFPEIFANVEVFESIIIQPEFEPPIDRYKLPAEVLDRFESKMITAIAMSKNDKPSATRGDWCKYCDCQPVCPAWRVEVDQTLNRNVPDSALDINELAEVYGRYEALKPWAEAAYQRLHHEQENGTKVDLRKLVAKRGTREWKDPQEAKAFFITKAIPPSIYEPPTLVTPAAAEKIKGVGKIPKELAPSISSGTNSVPITHKGAEVIPPQAVAALMKNMVGR